MFEPDARAAHGQSDPNESPYYVEYGRININFTSSGQLVHYYAPQHVVLDENSVSFNIVLLSTENPVTLYAVRRLKIESYQTDFSIEITPMQPNVHRGTSASHGFFANKHKPVDFSCAEIDRSSVTSGTNPAGPSAVPIAHVSFRNALGAHRCLFRYFRFGIKHDDLLHARLRSSRARAVSAASVLHRACLCSPLESVSSTVQRLLQARFV